MLRDRGEREGEGKVFCPPPSLYEYPPLPPKRKFCEYQGMAVLPLANYRGGGGGGEDKLPALPTSGAPGDTSPPLSPRRSLHSSALAFFEVPYYE